MKIVSIVGARPQFIKAAILSEELRRYAEEILVHTGQHYDENMSDVFFDELGIPRPDVHLGIGGGSHAEQTGQMMIAIEQVLLSEKPDWCIVYGDTNSTLAGALAAAKLHIRVAHVEAGLRSFKKSMPEEINRVLCDHVSDALFCPTEHAAQNLANEGIIEGVYVVGDVMADVLYRTLDRLPTKGGILNRLGLLPESYVLVTIHRASNTDDPETLRRLIGALGAMERKVVFPVHPRTRKALRRYGLELPENIVAIEPVGYVDMVQLEKNAECILTDSGGMQKEAYWLGVRCVTMREETEWVETVQVGWNRLVGSDAAAIGDAVENWTPRKERPPLYGNGDAAKRIAAILQQAGSGDTQ